MEKGVHIGLGLPNGTESTQEMDQGFTEYKPATDESTVCVAAKNGKTCCCLQENERNNAREGKTINRYTDQCI